MTFNIKQTNKNTLTKTISDLRIFQAFCNEPEIVIVPVSRKCTVGPTVTVRKRDGGDTCW